MVLREETIPDAYAESEDATEKLDYNQGNEGNQDMNKN